jgi:hypothetical protein
MSRLGTVIVCVATVLLAGCSGASSPRNVAGVRAMYRSVGLDAGAGDFIDICHSYMEATLSNEVKRSNNNCTTANSSSRLERWAEKIRLAKVGTTTRIAVTGNEALIYDGPEAEKVVYVSGQWRLSEVPELTPTKRAAPGG